MLIMYRMILSDSDIQSAIERNEIRFDPCIDPDLQLQPASIDLRLARWFRTFNTNQCFLIDPLAAPDLEQVTTLVEVKGNQPFIVHPGEFVLGSTLEYVWLSARYVARVDGRSSLGRMGIIIHSTAGYVDPGFEGTLTLEISNVGKIPVALYPAMRICQMSFYHTGYVTHPYGSQGRAKYQGQRAPTASRLGQDEEFRRKA